MPRFDQHEAFVKTGYGRIMTELYYIDLTDLQFDELFKRNEGRLSETRKEKIFRYKFDKDRLLSLGAGILLDEALREFGLKEKDIRIELGENGKPYLVDDPSIHYNISHSEKVAILAISSDKVGCDIQYYKDFDIKIAERFFTPEEYKYISRNNSDSMRNLAFGKIWTLKESYVKMVGKGLSLGLDTFNVLTNEGITEEAYFREYYQIPDYAVAVCSCLGDFNLSAIEVLV